MVAPRHAVETFDHTDPHGLPFWSAVVRAGEELEKTGGGWLICDVTMKRGQNL